MFGLGGRQGWRNWCVILRLNCVAKAWCQQPIENIFVSRVKREGYPPSFACCIARLNVNNLHLLGLVVFWVSCSLLSLLCKKKYFLTNRNDQIIVKSTPDFNRKYRYFCSISNYSRRLDVGGSPPSWGTLAIESCDSQQQALSVTQPVAERASADLCWTWILLCSSILVQGLPACVKLYMALVVSFQQS